ncbi:hypothetical protein MAR_032762, partial [Mya arenaria]
MDLFIGKNGTRFAIVTFASTATVHLQIDDKNVRTVNSTIAKINEITTVNAAEDVLILDTKIDLLKVAGYEIFTMGVGRNINKLMLKKIASEPTEEHVFLINQFKDLKAIGDTIAEKNIDY